MKILLLSPYKGIIGGIVLWTNHILNYYKNNKCDSIDLDLLPMDRTTATSGRRSFFNRILNAFKDYYPVIKSFNRKIRENKYDLIHIATSGSISFLKDYYIIKKAKKRGIKTALHLHFGRIPELAENKTWEWKLFCKIQKIVDTIIVIDSKSYKALMNCGFTNINFLPNPVAPVVNSVIVNNHINREERTILFVGHVVPTKGIYELVDACKNIENIKLIFLGAVTDEVKQNLMQKANGADWLVIEGEKSHEEVIKEMMACAIFCLPSYTEGFPNVILESMACGCAIVSTTVGAIPEMLEEEDGKKYGILVEPKDVKSLHNALNKMLSDKNLKNECQKNVVERVNERYNIEAVWNQMTDIWQNTINK